MKKSQPENQKTPIPWKRLLAQTATILSDIPFYCLAFALALWPVKRGKKMQFPGKTLFWSQENDEVTEFLAVSLFKFWSEVYTSEVHASISSPALLKDIEYHETVPSGFFAAIKYLRKNKFQTVVFLQPMKSIRPGIIAWLAGAQNRVGFGRSFAAAALNFKLPFQDTGAHMCHQWKQLIENCSLQKLKTLPFPTFAPAREMAPIFNTEKLALIIRKTMVLDPFATDSRSLLPHITTDQIEELQYKLQNQGYNVRIVHLDEDREFPESITFDELFSVAKKADLIIDFDSVGGHIAAAAGAKVLSVFAERSERAFQPFQNKSRAFGMQLPCRPCSRSSGGFHCINKTEFQCVNELNFDNVLQVLKPKNVA